ncbi:MAG: hypothetical protein BYD32DRAFT_418543 [Podila humilis]|nr:MAG: hypothetical protein BYD32DRAFT_418543 [Podila humilis]
MHLKVVCLVALLTVATASPQFSCTYQETVGGGEEGPPETVTVKIESRGQCVEAANNLDFCNCNSKDAMDRPGCRMTCTNLCAQECLSQN